jgi:hypothetical protein
LGSRAPSTRRCARPSTIRSTSLFVPTTSAPSGARTSDQDSTSRIPEPSPMRVTQPSEKRNRLSFWLPTQRLPSRSS